MGTDKSSNASEYFTAIVKNAEVGWANLRTFFSNRYPGVTFVLRSFALITDKKVHDTVKNEVQVKLGGVDVDLIVFSEGDFRDVFARFIRAI